MAKDTPKHPIDRGAPASVIADKFGGLVGFCDALTEARRAIDGPDAKAFAPSTVHRWLVKGSIDAKYHALTNRAAELRRVRIKPTDYLDLRKPMETAIAAEAAAA
jgi:hypothetical protein